MAGKPNRRAADWSVIAALPEPAVVTADGWNKGGATIQFANREFCLLTGYTAEELVGKNTRLLHGPRTDITVLQYGRTPGQPPDKGRGEGWLYRKDGSEFYADWRYRSLNGETGPLVVLYRDHSEHMHQRSALLQAQKLGTIGLLAGGAAHDFNNLLSVINGYSEILIPKIAHLPEAHRDAQEIQRSGINAAAIARQILEFSRRQETAPSVVNFNPLIRELAEIIRRVCGETIRVELRLDSDLGNARISPTHFQQVLLNLCFNGRDAMPRGGQLTLHTSNRQVPAKSKAGKIPAGSYVVLRVVDSGIGIDPGLGDRIFEPFYTTKPMGTGLGLSTAQSIIHQANGYITVTSKPGAGAAFEVLLPETTEAENDGATALSVLPTALGTEAILLIEQDVGLRKMISGILGLDGYTVTETNRADAVDLSETRPQLVIIDSNAKPAAELLRELVKTNRQLRVISIAPEARKIPGLKNSACTHLPKPFALSALLTQVRALLDGGGKNPPDQP